MKRTMSLSSTQRYQLEIRLNKPKVNMKNVVDSRRHHAHRIPKSKPVRPSKPKAKKYECERCEPNLTLVPTDHSPGMGEFIFIVREGYQKYLNLKPENLAFVQKYGYPAYKYCKDHFYDPRLDEEELAEFRESIQGYI